MNTTATPALSLVANRPRRWSATRGMSYAFSALAAGFVVVLVVLFVWQSIPAWRHEGMGFLSGKKWFFRQQQFGALAMIYGTIVVSFIALLLAAPIGIGAAIFSAEFIPRRLRLAVKVLIELLAGIPSVVYGLLGILFLRDWVYRALTPFDPLSGDTLLTAGILLAVMILPTVMTLCDDALRDVPAAQRQAARGLGLTQTEVVLSVCLPQAARGMIAAVLLALGRALGEAIAVFLVIGRQDNQWPANPFSLQPLIESGQTLTSKLASSETNIAYGDPLHWAAIVSLGLVLLVMTVTVTVIGTRLMRPREQHA
ncbi:MAG TPA: phosphate ABC transporter permease subunit PstC [Methylomirabilota bacterium]|nr:phosphate ABC transporter permease subunit PstC [Methylomirabilota bacterium]